MNDKQWLEARKGKITATRVPAILGKHPFMSRYEAWLDIKGYLDVEENEAMRMGKVLEPVVAKMYEQATGDRLRRWPGTLSVHKDYPHFAASPDRAVNKKNKLLEIKTTNRFSFKNWGIPGTDNVPDYVYLQCAWQMAITGYDQCDVAALVDGRDLNIYHINRDDELNKFLLDEMDKFYFDHVMQDKPPEIDYFIASPELIAGRWPTHNADFKQPTKHIDAIIREYFEFEERRSNLSDIIEGLKNEIKDFIGDSAGVIADDYKISWSMSKPRTNYSAAFNDLANGIDPAKVNAIINANKSTTSRRFLPTQLNKNHN